MISLKNLSGGGSTLGLRPLGGIQTVTSFLDQTNSSDWITIYNSTTFVQVHGLGVEKASKSYSEVIDIRVTNLGTGAVWAIESTPVTTGKASKTIIGHSIISTSSSNSSAAKISPSYTFEGGLKVEMRSSHNAASKGYVTCTMNYTEVEER